jgi:hypothetical protein
MSTAAQYARALIWNRKYIPDYSVLYSERIERISTAIRAFDARLSGAFDGLYNTLVESRLSENCNDASLILRQLSELVANGWPQQYADGNKNSLTDIALHT